GTHAGELVESAGAGRQVDYSAEAIARQLRELRDDRGALEALTVQVEQEREQHTWRARALQVAADLSAGGPARLAERPRSASHRSANPPPARAHGDTKTPWTTRPSHPSHRDWSRPRSRPIM